MLIVYRQADPIRVTAPPDRYGYVHESWVANLVKIGTVETWEQAKKLTSAPIVEAVR